jgi:hypothetical protein
MGPLTSSKSFREPTRTMQTDGDFAAGSATRTEPHYERDADNRSTGLTSFSLFSKKCCSCGCAS